MSHTRIALTVVVLLTAMGVSAYVGRRSRLGAVLLTLLSVLWLLINSNFEGPVLLDFSKSHGLTSSDLVGIAGIALAAWLWHRAGRLR